MSTSDYRALAERIPQQVWAADRSGALDYVNPVVLAYFGQSSEAILGAGWQAVIHPDDLASCVERWTASLKTGVDYEIEFRLRHRDGAYRWHLGRANPERDASGQIVRWFGTNTDIDDRKAAAELERELVAESAARVAAVDAEQRIVEVLESIAEPLLILDADWRVTFVNVSCARLLRMDRDAIVGGSLWTQLADPSGSLLYRETHRARAERTPVSFEEYFAPLGTWIEVHAYPSRSGSLTVHLRDIHLRKLLDAQHARERRHVLMREDVGAALSRDKGLAEILDGCVSAMVRHLDVAFARIWTLNHATNTLELEASAGIYTHLDGPHGRVPVGKFKIGRIAQTREPHLTNDVAHDPQVGDPAWAARTGMVAFAGYPLVVDDKCVGVVAMFSRDPLAADTIAAIATVADTIAQGIERKRAEIALGERAAELARSNAELERFAYVASHDLQEPLRMVASYTQLLSRRYKGKLDQAADEFIGFAVDGANRMQALINDLLTFSRVGTRGSELAMTPLEVPFATAIANLQIAIQAAGAVITHDPLPTLQIDQQQLIQLFQNLIGNAIKFRSEAAPTVHVGATRESGSWVVSVRDNGIGISAEYYDRLFVLFQRLHTRSEFPGNGIGLAICKKIVERHGGRIWVESTPGQGTIFLFTLRSTEK